MSVEPRAGVEGVKICYHGGPNYAELEKWAILPDEILDFSANTNPFGPPPGITEALAEVDIAQYPDSETSELRRSLALKLGVSPQNILVGNGSTEIIRLAALAYFGPDNPVLIIEPTFGEYEVACQIVQAPVLKQQLSAQEGFKLNVKACIELIHKEKIKGVFISNPNNPTGQYLAKGEVEQILAASDSSLVVLDEAYVSFVAEAWSSLDLITAGNLVVVRSMTKDYALAGLRLGYAIATAQITTTLRRLCPPWNVNSLAQRAGILALNEEGYLEQCQLKLKSAKDFLVAELARLGLPPLPSQANFFLVKVGDGPKFRQALLQQGILVRDCTSFGLPQYIRLSPGTMPQCQRLIGAIKEIVRQRSACQLNS